MIELCAPVVEVRIRRMFGGTGVFHGDTMFALIAYDELYLKVDDGNAARFEEAGMGRFTYEREGAPAMTMSYAKVPPALYDDAEAFAPWLQDALAAAARNAKKKRRPSAGP
ncbi:MAG: TfoX/Sxy family protein, partial [Pseudomonadota bacterium]